MIINFVAVIIVLIILGGAIAYIVKSKKKGVKCIGCPAAGNCSSNHHEHSEHSCGCHQDQK